MTNEVQLVEFELNCKFEKLFNNQCSTVQIQCSNNVITLDPYVRGTQFYDQTLTMISHIVP